MIQATNPENLPEVTPTLAVWTISGKSTKISEGATKFLLASWRQISSKTYDSLLEMGPGVMKGTVILFHALYK